MACYNAEAYLAAAIESVLSQTFKHFELIIVDDGSTDRSAEIATKYERNNVLLLRKENGGAAMARNAAFRRSIGRFVIFLDADDLVSPLHLEALYSRAAENPGCIALSQWDRFYTDPREAVFPSRPTEQDLAGAEWLLLDWTNARPMTQSGMLLLPRDLLEQHGGWNERLSLHDDFEFFARMISKSNGIRFAPAAKLYYRSGLAQSLSRRRSREAVESAFWSFVLGTGHLLAVENSPRARRVCANILQDFDYTYFPDHADLRRLILARVSELGGGSLEPDGPPGFHRLRKLFGWKLARRAQRMVDRCRGDQSRVRPA